MDVQPIQQSEALHQIVVRQIERNIREKKIKPGDRLPNEQQLAEQFGVSRTVIREAIMILRQANVLDVRHGVGTFVAEPLPEHASEQIARLLRRQTRSIWEVHEIRSVLEPELAALAAERIDEEGLDELHKILDAMASSIADTDRYIQLDFTFHSAIAAATKNTTFGLILSPVMDIMLENRKLCSAVPGAKEQTLRDHQQVLEAIESGNARCAHAAMVAHLKNVTASIRAHERTLAESEKESEGRN